MIIDEKANGPYKSFADLKDRIRGLGPVKIQKLKDAGFVVSLSELGVHTAQVLPAPAMGMMHDDPRGQTRSVTEQRATIIAMSSMNDQRQRYAERGRSLLAETLDTEFSLSDGRYSFPHITPRSHYASHHPC